MFDVLFAQGIEKSIKKLFSKKEKIEFETFMIKTLLYVGNKVGDPIRYPFFREKKFSGKRVYYLVYLEFGVILIVGVSNKKNQHRIIQEIINNLEKYRELALEYHNKKIKDL